MTPSRGRKALAALFAVTALTLGAAACDDAPENEDKIDEDDRRLGPGDGEDETGPGR